MVKGPIPLVFSNERTRRPLPDPVRVSLSELRDEIMTLAWFSVWTYVFCTPCGAESLVFPFFFFFLSSPPPKPEHTPSASVLQLSCVGNVIVRRTNPLPSPTQRGVYVYDRGNSFCGRQFFSSSEATRLCGGIDLQVVPAVAPRVGAGTGGGARGGSGDAAALAVEGRVPLSCRRLT